MENKRPMGLNGHLGIIHGFVKKVRQDFITQYSLFAMCSRIKIRDQRV